MPVEVRAKWPGSEATKAPAWAAVLLVCGFIGVVAWFNGVDFYHRHFFESGPIVAVDNLLRMVFVGIFSWLIYVPGAAIAVRLMSASERAALSPPERAVLGFGIGVGVWHVGMLILGVAGLYYRLAMVMLCLVVLTASARHFADVAVSAWRALSNGCSELRRQRRVSPKMIGAILFGVAAMWLLLLRALFPGGGGDYYTHYFYYYLEVLKNHGLAPNDVWYHYYYSKGSGLAFLGMLLTDPEAPALTTYACVVCAALAIATLAARLAPNSLWPAAGATVYMLFYLCAFSPDGSGQFQKDHEEVAALVTLVVWALCMDRCGLPSRPFRVMAAASAIAAAIITQSVGILLGLFVGLLCIWSLLRRRFSDVWAYGCVGAAIAGTVLAVFVLSYLETGLATDQPLDLMLRFADACRLDRWGVIPQIIAVAWIRDNYLALVPPLGWNAFWELADFTRFNFIWPFLLGPILALPVLLWAGAFAGWRLSAPRDASAAAFAAVAVLRIAALIGLLLLSALVLGRGQRISFTRLSTFFVPLQILLVIAASTWGLNWPLPRRGETALRLFLPTLLLAGVGMFWQIRTDWLVEINLASKEALKFLVGRSSLAEAYGHAVSGYAFGAIDPAVLAAARQLPSGTPIWSTNVASLCMVPGCQIESVISFKMSGRLDEILGDDPDLAKLRLQQAGLNYFLFMKDHTIIDLLPFGRLFAPDVIGRYLGVKWSDGSAFLLTWIGPETTPLGGDFLDAYERQRAEPDRLGWFRFDELASRIVAISPNLRAAAWGEAERTFTWRHPAPGTIDIVQATYGGNCRNLPAKQPWNDAAVWDGNASGAVKGTCAGKSRCQFVVGRPPSYDAAPDCDADFTVTYRCGPADPTARTVRIESQADGKLIGLDCAGTDGPHAKSN